MTNPHDNTHGLSIVDPPFGIASGHRFDIGPLIEVHFRQRQHKPHRPSIKTMIEQAEKAGKPLASITLADGTKLDFGKPELAEPENPWLADLRKETKQ